MALATKFRSEFKDILQLAWKTDFEVEGFGGSITDMEPTDSPLSFEFLASTDDLHQDPIRGTKVNFGIYSQTNFQFIEFADADDLGIRASVYWATNLYWRGFILPGNYSESYDGAAYPVMLSASDGLGLLNNILFDNAGTYYTGRKTAAEIIYLILSEIGFTGFTEYINIYEENFDSSETDSPLDQDYIDCDLFQDKYCYEVLGSILNKFEAIIKQKDGGFIIYRPDDLYLTTIYGRIFTSATAKTGTSKSNQYFIDRKLNPSGFADVDGGGLNVKRSAKKIVFNQDYGYKDSWIDNWKLLAKSWIGGAGGFFENWIAGSGWSRIIIPGNPDGMVLYSVSSVPPNYRWAYQSFGVYAKASSDVFIFSFDYKFFNYSGASRTMTFFLRIKSDDGNHWLYIVDEDEAGWDSSAHDFTFSDTSEIGKSEWRTFERKINGIPLGGSYTITLYGLHNSGAAGVYTFVQNFRFIATSDELSIIRTPKPTWFERFIFGKMGSRIREAKKHPRVVTYKDVEEVAMKVYTKTNSNNGANLDFDFILGDVDDANIDNVLEQLQGSTAYRYISGYTGAIAKVDKVTKSPYPQGCNISCNGYTHALTWTTNAIISMTNFIASFGTSFGSVTFTNNLDGSCNITADVQGVDFAAASIDGSGSTAVNITPNYIGDPVYAFNPTAIWNSRTPGGEDKALLNLISDELKLQFSRTREILQLPIIENLKNGNEPQVDISGSFIDSLNEIGSETRYFALNRGTFDVRNREWNIDLIEIIPIPEEA